MARPFPGPPQTLKIMPTLDWITRLLLKYLLGVLLASSLRKPWNIALANPCITIYKSITIHMDRETEGQSFPYRDREDVIYFQEDVEDSGQLKQKSDVGLYRRFPWLQFKNPRHKKKYIYKGKNTEQVHPFFIRFNMSQEIEVGSPQLEGQNFKIDDKLRQVVQGVINPLGFDKDSQLVASVKMLRRVSDKYTNYSFLSAYHDGYLLTGIARPSTTANDAFDALFVTLPHSKTLLSPSGSNRTQLKEAYNVMKLNWQYKYHSYEYFSFMSRAYRELSKALRSILREQEVEQAASHELFNYSRARVIQYLNSRHMSQAMKETEYFNFLSKLFSKHHQHILGQIEKHPHLKDGRMVLELDGKHHQLREFQYQTYLKRQFEGVQLQEQALNNMVEHNRKRNMSIIQKYPFKTRRDRVQQLMELTNGNKQIYNRIELIPMTDLREHTPPGQQNRHFLLAFRMDERAVPSCTLREVIERRIGSNSSVTIKMYKQRLFKDIYIQENRANQYSLLKHFTCSPEGLLLQQKIIVPNFKKALQIYLQLNKLPLTHQQELLECTPCEDINIYEKLQELVEEYEYCQKENAMSKLYSVLNDERFDFSAYDQYEEVKLDVGSARLKMKLLQLSMIEYEISNNGRCLHATSNGHIVPYNSYTPQHYKELKQYLAILLVETNIITNSKITKRPTDTPKAIQDIAKIYQQNSKQYLRYIEPNAQRPFFSQVNQDAFRKTIQDFFKDLEEYKIPGFNQQTIKQALRISHRVYLIIEVIEARTILSKQTNFYANEEIIVEQLKSLHPFISSFVQLDRKDDRPKILLNLKEQNPRFYAELRESLAVIKKELAQCHQLFKHHSLRSKQGIQLLRGPSPPLQSSIGKLNGFSLLWLSAIFKDIMKYQQSGDFQKLLTLYKILMCFCCHLPQFHRNQVLQHQIKASELTNERLQEKICTFKNILLAELAGFMVRNPEKYLGEGRSE